MNLINTTLPAKIPRGVPKYGLYVERACQDTLDKTLKDSKIPVRCLKAEYNLPVCPLIFMNKQRLILRMSEGDESGYWVHVALQHKYIYLLKATNFSTIILLMASLCENCCLPKYNCSCGNFRVSECGFKMTANDRSVSNYTRLLCNFEEKIEYIIFDFNKEHTLSDVGSDSGSDYLFHDIDDSEISVEFQTDEIDVEIQADLIDVKPKGDSMVDKAKSQLMEAVGLNSTLNGKLNEALHIIESIGLLVVGLQGSYTIGQLVLAFTNFVKMLHGSQSVVLCSIDYSQLIFEKFSDYFVQQSDDDWLEKIDDLFDDFESIKRSKFGRRFLNVTDHIVAQFLLSKINIVVDPVVYKQFEEKSLRPSTYQSLTFAKSVLALITCTLTVGRQCMQAKSYSPLFINGAATAQWFIECKAIEKQYNSLGMSGSADNTAHEFMLRLDKGIDVGVRINQLNAKATKTWVSVEERILALRDIKFNYLAIQAAQTMRVQPFCVLLYGDPGVGKSSLIDFIWHYTCKLMDLSDGNENKYSFNSAEKWMNNFKSYMHTCVLDDVAQHNPAKVQGIDPSIEFFMSMVNNIPWNTPQADVDVKGSAPFLCKQVFVTSNVVDLNLPQYYPKTKAPMRRISVHIEPIVKDIYLNENKKFKEGIFTDPNLKDHDFWNFKIRKMVGDNRMQATFVDTGIILKSKSELLQYLKPRIIDHFKEQAVMMANAAKMKEFKLCEHKFIKEYCEDCKELLETPVAETQADVVEEKGVKVKRTSYTPPGIIRIEDTSDDEYVQLNPFNNNSVQLILFHNSEGKNMNIYFSAHLENKVIKYTLIDNFGFVKKIEKGSFTVGYKNTMIKFYLKDENCEIDVLDKKVFNPFYSEFAYCQPTVYRGIDQNYLVLQRSGRIVFVMSEEDFLRIPCYFDSKTKLFVHVLNDHRRAISYLIQNTNNVAVKKPRTYWNTNVEICEVEKCLDPSFSSSPYYKSPWRKFDWISNGNQVPCTKKTQEHFLQFYLSKQSRSGYVNMTPLDLVFVEYYCLNILPLYMSFGHSLRDGWDDCSIYLKYMYFTSHPTMLPLIKKANNRLSLVDYGTEPLRYSKVSIHSSNSYFHKMKVALFRLTKFGYVSEKDIAAKLPKKNMFHKMGEEIDKASSNIWVQATLVAVVAIAPLIIMAVFFKKLSNGLKQKRKSLLFEESVEKEEDEIQEQFSIEDLPVPVYSNNERGNNVWEQEKERNVTSVNFDSKNVSQVDGFEKAMSKVCLYATFEYNKLEDNETKRKRIRNRILMLTPEVFLINNHAIPNPPYDAEVFYNDGAKNCKSTTKFKLTDYNLERYPDIDLCLIKTKALANFYKDIALRSLSKNNLNGTFNGFLLIKQDDGSFKKILVADVKQAIPSETINTTFDFTMWQYTFLNSDDVTVKGDCGSPLVIETDYGLTILGLHALIETLDERNPNKRRRGFATMVTKEMFSKYCSGVYPQCGELDITPYNVVDRRTSYIDFHEDAHILYHGEIDKYGVRFKHHVRNSEIKQQILDNTDFVDSFTTPKIGSYKAMQVGLTETLHPVNSMDEEILSKVCNVFYDHIMNNLDLEELKLISPTNLKVAVNGMPGMYAMDGIKKNTSKGWPKGGCKRSVMVPLDDEFWQDGYTFTEEMMSHIQEKFDSYKKGIRCHPIFVANFKDEVISQKKADMFKVRIFYSGPLFFVVISRMLFMNFSRVFMRNRFIFCHAIGMNCHSIEWQNLMEVFCKHGLMNMVAGDFQFFDKKIQMVLINWIYHLIYKICKASGNFDDLDLFVQTFMADAASPSVDFFGMLLTFLSGEVSGHQITTMFNCMLTLFYLMYSFEKIGYDCKSFFDLVSVVSLGDDHVLSSGCPEFNHTNIQKVMTDLGLGYTMADKSSESIPFITIDKVDFLKRKFLFNEILNSWVAPLEKKSIYRMLCYQVISKSVCREEQLAQSMVSAANESFFHGEEFFNKINNLIKSLNVSPTLEIYMEKYPLFTKKEIIERFVNSVDDVQSAAWLQGRNQTGQLIHSYCSELGPLSLKTESMDELTRELLEKVKLEQKARVANENNYNFESAGVTQSDIEIIGYSKSNNASTVLEEANTANSSQEQTTFINEVVNESLNISNPLDRIVESQIVNQQLDQFLKRPVEIFNFTWTENAPAGLLETDYYPWTLFLSNPVIARKLSNFSLFRGNLKLKFIINASQFYYGSLLAAYTPLKDFLDENDVVDVSLLQVKYSQRPHVWLEPQNSSAVEFTLPYLYYYNFSKLDVAEQTDLLGKIQLLQYAALRSANGITTSGVTVICYAWMEDVELTGLTSTTDAILQSDEYTLNGQISGPASTVAKYAAKLSDAPIIGGYAKATSMIANKIGQVASIFGFSNVPNIEDVKPMKNLPFHTLASTEISEPINKLSLTAKQETSMFGKIDGNNEDVLTISNFVNRESFLCGTVYTTTQVENTILFTSAVEPHMLIENSGCFTLTPLGYASSFFDYWRGDIIFKFKIIKTMYHKGRINISWDQNMWNSAEMPLSGTASVYNVVVDLSETDTVEVRVPYINARPFLENTKNYVTPQWSNGGSPTFTTNSKNVNGMLQVRVLNRLTAPEASSDVDILVFVRAAENLEFSRPCDLDNHLNTVQTQSDVITLGSPSSSDVKVYSEMIGEQVLSFRQLLHRQSRSGTLVIDYTPGANEIYSLNKFPLRRLPPFAGYAPDGSSTRKSVFVPANSHPFNYVAVHPINAIVSCFLGYKGSTNITVNAQNISDIGLPGPLQKLAITRANLSSITSKSRMSLNSTDSSAVWQDKMRYGQLTAATGQALTNQFTQSGISVNLPYYINNKFTYVDARNLYSLTGRQDDLAADCFELECVTSNMTTDQLTRTLLDTYYGTGPDFDVMFFMNVPLMYWNVGALP